MEREERKLKILTVTSNALSGATGIGSTFKNFFEGLEGVSVASVYTGYGVPEEGFPQASFRITEKSLIKNRIRRSVPSGERVFAASSEALSASERKGFDAARKVRLQVLLSARELIWKVGKPVSPELKEFVSEFDPDVIFAQINDTCYLTNLTGQIAKFSSKPVCLFIGDDFCSLKRIEFSPLFWIDRLIKRHTHKKLISKSARVFMMTDQAKREYDSMFGIECKTATKSLDFSGEPGIKEPSLPVRFVYTGNLYNGRWRSVAAIGSAIDQINNKRGDSAELFIWSATPLTAAMQKAFDLPCVHFEGCAPASDMPGIQQQADVLVHAEATSKRRAAVVRLSFSTKLVDYMHAARCILAVGPKGQASMEHLKEHDAAVCVFDLKELSAAVEKLIVCPDVIREYAKKAWECGRSFHDSKTVRGELVRELTEAAQAAAKAGEGRSSI